ncbi:MAG: hypothetical protein V7603_645 [Micromonosporaceae bacterium]
MDNELVPVWCGFFAVDEYDLFSAAVDNALGLFGAEGQDIDEGYVELAAGDPEPEVYGFALTSLAVRCRAAATEQWPDICARQVMDWAEGEPQRTWLRNAPFGAVEHQMDAWLTGTREVKFDGDPEGSEQPFSVQVADGLYVSFLAEVPDLDDAPEMRSFVPNAAVHAWQLSAEDLLESARRRLRQLPPPNWDRKTVRIEDDNGNTIGTADVYLGSAPPDVSTPVSSWALILDEVGPVSFELSRLAAVPHRHLLIVDSPSEDPKAVKHRIRALDHHANHAYQTAADTDRVSSLKYVYRPPGNFRSFREYSQAREASSQ